MCGVTWAGCGRSVPVDVVLRVEDGREVKVGAASRVGVLRGAGTQCEGQRAALWCVYHPPSPHYTALPRITLCACVLQEQSELKVYECM